MRQLMTMMLSGLLLVACGSERERGPDDERMLIDQDEWVSALADAGFSDAEPAPEPDPEPEPDPVDPGPTDAEVAVMGIREIVQEYCNRAHSCLSAMYSLRPELTPEDFYREYGANEAECFATRFSMDYDELLTSAVEEGRTSYDPARGARCLEQIDDDYLCLDFWVDGLDECAALFAGTVARAEACAIHVECRSERCEDGLCR